MGVMGLLSVFLIAGFITVVSWISVSLFIDMIDDLGLGEVEMFNTDDEVETLISDMSKGHHRYGRD